MIVPISMSRRVRCSVYLLLASAAPAWASAPYAPQQHAPTSTAYTPAPQAGYTYPQAAQPYPPTTNYAAPAAPAAPQATVLPAQQPTLAAPQHQPAFTQPVYQPQAGYSPAAPQVPVRVAMDDNELPAPAPAVAEPQASSYGHPTAYPSHGTGDCAQPGCAPTNYAPAAPCNTCTAAPTTSYYGAATGDCGSGSFGTGCSPAPACDLGCAPVGPSRQWFFGAYGLYMTRDNPGRANTAVLIDDTTTITTPYYPDSMQDFLFTSEADVEAQWGYEFRFGSTFGCDPYGCGQPFAWEVGYWSLEEDESQATRLITMPLGPGTTERIYGMKSYAGLEYDRDGTGATYAYRPLNEYMDYQMPVTNPAPDDLRVVGVRVRQRFELDNLELNFWRFGMPTTTPTLGCSTTSCGTSSCGDPCGTAACNTSCRPPRRFFINGVMGVRYVTIDEEWQNAIQFTAVDGTGTPLAGEPTNYTGFPVDDDNVLFHDIETENRLLGFQLGCSMNWLVGCSWNFFADSNFGVYNNDMDVYQRVYSGGGGTVRFVGDATNAEVRANKSDVAMLGELRFGVGYQINCNWRLTTAYRMIGMTGVALGVEQVPANFSNSDLLRYVDGNDSIFMHGLQTGVECKY